MAPDYFDQLLRNLLLRTPFQPFTIELHNGKRFEIDHQLATVSRAGKAVFVSPGGVLVFFDHDSVVQVIDSPAHSAP